MTSLTSHRFAERTLPGRAGGRIISNLLHRPAICSFMLFGADCLAILGSTSAAIALCGGVGGLRSGAAAALSIPQARPAQFELMVLFAGVLVYLAAKGRYCERVPFWSDVRLVIHAIFWPIVVLTGLALLNVIQPMPVLGALLLFPPFATLANRFAKYALAWSGLWAQRVIVLGGGPTTAELRAALESDRSLGYHIVGEIDSTEVLSSPVAPRLRSVLERYEASRLLIAIDGSRDLQDRVVGSALREQVPFALVPQPSALPAFAFDKTSLLGHDPVLLSFRNGLSRPALRISKAGIDVAVAALLLIVASPLFLVIALAVCLDGGPVLFAHRRVGASGRHFRCLKFRTMVVDADRALEKALASDAALAAEWQTTRKLRDDPRITRPGRFLRATSLDELPQLINVLRLEMSLVGPRPIVDSEIPLYGDSIAQYYATRPGLTGLWQVSGRSDTSYARRVHLDTWYVNNWTIWHDIVVLLKTVPVVVCRVGAR